MRSERLVCVAFGRVHDTGLEYIDTLGEVENAEEEAAHAEEKTKKVPCYVYRNAPAR